MSEVMNTNQTTGQTEIKLTDAEVRFVKGLGLTPELEATALANALKAKIERQAGIIENREVFSIEINDIGNLVIRGLGNRFPLGLRPDSAEKLVTEHVEAVKVKVKEAREYIAANPEKVAAAKAKRQAENKAARAKQRKSN